MKDTPKDQQEYWRWQEYHRVVTDRSWKGKDLITAGVDVGSVGSKAAIMIDGEIYSWAVTRTGSNSPDSAIKVMGMVLDGTGLKHDDIKFTVGTGYGRVNVPMAQKAITEIACHAKGANYIWGQSVRTILDVGGQDIKAIRCDETGRVTSFLMNDKCAAGTGRGMEVFADLLQIPIEDIGKVSLSVDEEPPPVSCTCVAFAKTEAIGLLRRGWTREKVLAAYRAGIKTIILPNWNRKDMEDIPANVQKAIKFHFVSDMLEVLKLALENGPAKKN